MEHQTLSQIKRLHEAGQAKKWDNIYHVAIIATYKEDKEILESTIEAVKNCDFPLNRVIIVLATEERDRERAEENSAYLTQKFAGKFYGFFYIYASEKYSGEIIGKSRI